MSDTVEKIMCAVTCLSYPRATIENVVKKIEDQNDRLVNQCVKNVEEIGQLRAELREAKKDADRFQYLFDNQFSMHCETGDILITREGIDKAMEARKL